MAAKRASDKTPAKTTAPKPIRYGTECASCTWPMSVLNLANGPHYCDLCAMPDDPGDLP